MRGRPVLAKWSANELVGRLHIPHAGSLYSSKWMIEFSEGLTATPDWQIIKIDLTNFIGIRTNVKIELIPDRCAQRIYVGQNGGRDLGYIDTFSNEVEQTSEAEITLIREGAMLSLEINLYVDDGCLLIGGYSKLREREYVGRGDRLLSIASISAVEAVASMRPNLIVLDIGASGGIDPTWDPYTKSTKFILVEPDPVGADALRQSFAATANVSILEAALAGEDGKRTLNVTVARACSSLLEPDRDALSRYAVAPLFEVAERITVDCKRYDVLAATGAPVPDFVKLDTQGTELEILRGFGDLLHSVSGIKLEAHFYPIYHGQPSISEIVSYLDKYGLALREMSPCWSFDQELVEVDCLFMRRDGPDTPNHVSEKIAFLKDIFRLPEHTLGAELAKGFQ